MCLFVGVAVDCGGVLLLVVHGGAQRCCCLSLCELSVTMKQTRHCQMIIYGTGAIGTVVDIDALITVDSCLFRGYHSGSVACISLIMLVAVDFVAAVASHRSRCCRKCDR